MRRIVSSPFDVLDDGVAPLPRPIAASVEVADGPYWETWPGGFLGSAGESLFVSQRWVEALNATYGFEIRALCLVSARNRVAALAYCDVEDICGRRILSLPFSDYADPVAATPQEWEALVAPLMARRVPIRLRCLRNAVPSNDARFHKRVHAVWHGTDLRMTETEIWSALKGSARQNIRRAERSGVKVRASNAAEDLRAFYRLHTHVRKTKYRLFAQPFAFFENLHASFGTDLFVLLAEVDGRPIAGIMFLIHGDALYYKFNASTDWQLRPNDLLVWNGILIGRERGLRLLDFGISDLDQPGLVRFKRKFASSEAALAELRWSPDGYSDTRDKQAQEALRQLTALLTAPGVPDDLTNRVGEKIYGFFC